MGGGEGQRERESGVNRCISGQAYCNAGDVARKGNNRGDSGLFLWCLVVVDTPVYFSSTFQEFTCMCIYEFWLLILTLLSADFSRSWAPENRGSHRESTFLPPPPPKLPRCLDSSAVASKLTRSRRSWESTRAGRPSPTLS